MSDEKIDIGYEWKKEERKPKKKAFYALTAMVISVILIAGGALWSYNSLVTFSESVSGARAQIESNIQRKADLLPNLVRTVKAYTRHEEKVFTEVAKLRNQARKSLQQGDLKAVADLNRALDGATLKLMAVAENYPDLKASEQFLQLQSQIEGTENRINITRMNYNEAVRRYNAALRRIPGRFIAPLAGLKPAAYFRAEVGSKTPLKLEI